MIPPPLKDVRLLLEAQLLVRGASRMYVAEAHRRLLLCLAEAPALGTSHRDAWEHLHAVERPLALAVRADHPAALVAEALDRLCTLPHDSRALVS